ncbi:STARD3 (predicted) [Pycnogonum litorale]
MSLENFASENEHLVTDSKWNMANPINIHNTRTSRLVNGYSQPLFIDQEALKQGIAEEGRISAVRRFFCLVVTFDLLFILLIWLICNVISGLTIKQAFVDDVVHYNVKNSMFDVFLLSCVRFTVLLLAYALLLLNHWWVVAISTALSCGFLICKVFFFNFTAEWTRASTFHIFLLLCSFILSWIEAWFFDCRVLPLERKAVQIIGGFDEPDERSSLLHRYLRGSTAYTESIAGTFYYSPNGTPAGSDDEEDVPVSRLLTAKELEFKKKAKETLETVLSIVNSDGWKLEKTSKYGDTVHSKRDKQVGKVFLLKGIVEINPEQLLKELFYRMEEIPKWNPTVLYCKILQKIDSHTDISYNVAAEGAGGLVAARDFVNIRHWELRDGVFISCGISVTHPDMPPQKNYTRGENGPGAWIMKPIIDDANKCEFLWLLNTNLKGWLPQYLVDQALSGVMLDYIMYVRKYVNKLEEQMTMS